MTPTSAEPKAATDTAAATATLVFDGDCGFCTRTVLWLGERWARPVRSVPWQSADLAALGLTEEQTRRAAWWVGAADETPRRRGGGHRAVAYALGACRPPWPVLGWILRAPPPLSWIFAAGYRLVARFRGYLPGATPACRLPSWPPDQH
ncbi:MAG: DUF393 domain-containing protein [Acidobacteria bacterium]|nr:DUF393 domain-containing protein [Acidobacteriota bacterium]